MAVTERKGVKGGGSVHSAYLTLARNSLIFKSNYYKYLIFFLPPIGGYHYWAHKALHFIAVTNYS